MLLRYEDGYQYQNVFAPLVKLEADEDRLTKEGLRQEGVTLRWDTALNRNKLAHFRLARPDSEFKLMSGEERTAAWRQPPPGDSGLERSLSHPSTCSSETVLICS